MQQQQIIIAVALLAIVAVSNAWPTSNGRQLKPSIEDQLERCFGNKKLPHERLLLVWYSDKDPKNPIEYWRNIITDDLKLPQLAFNIQHADVQQNQMLFEMSSTLNAAKILRNYCKLFAEITEYRSQGYDDPELTYEIMDTDLDFTRS